MKNFEPTTEHIAIVCKALNKSPDSFRSVKCPFDIEDEWTTPTMTEELEQDLSLHAERCRRSRDDSLGANNFRYRVRWCQRLMMGYEKLPEKNALGEYILPDGLGTGIYVFQDLMEVGQ